VSIRELVEAVVRAFSVHVLGSALLILTVFGIWLVLVFVKRKPVDPERAAAITIRAWYAAVVGVLLLIVALAVINNR